MGNTKISLKLPTDYSDQTIKKAISKKMKLQNFSYEIDSKSLDARNKKNIHWLLHLVVSSPQLKSFDFEFPPELEIPYNKRSERVIIVGNGPAGFFAAYVLQKAGFNTTIIDRGSDVDRRAAGIHAFEETGAFDPKSNYAFGEGGAGTFSDGKLTSRSKHISQEKRFILHTYVKAGAPEEILYLNHPHIGSNKLKVLVKKLREMYCELGGEVIFENQLTNIETKNGCVKSIETNSGIQEVDQIILAIGHSAYESYKMLIRNGVPFRTKNFAIGSRMEHLQETINKAQWGHAKLPGVKAAEYRLTSKGDGRHRVFTFCMCPGGMVVPATAYKHTNIVNGMSNYERDGQFANAACVAAIHPDELAGKETSPLEALEWLERLETSFSERTTQYAAPACTIKDFLKGSMNQTLGACSYPLSLQHEELWRWLPDSVVQAMQMGLQDFIRRMKGFDRGILLGLESKTSAPIQVLRDKSGKVEGFSNLYMVGEGSGYAGGIISSAADGIKAALSIIDGA